MNAVDKKIMEDFIYKNVGEKEIWVQLAEESAELTQAAIKMHRLYEKNNRPRKKSSECIINVVEELADTMLCLEILGLEYCEEMEQMMDAKLKRWFESAGGCDS